jgi:hypothetical protein
MIRLLLLLGLVTGEALPQVASATLSGIVLDESGAAAPGVAVARAKERTGFTRTTVSGTDGNHVIVEVPARNLHGDRTKDGFPHNRLRTRTARCEPEGTPGSEAACRRGAGERYSNGPSVRHAE